ncbi:hypothetical protein [Edwardsiella tarda]|uniref:hypothetical protein n=1 Tax=Edwardsiella tarda TaxID=636 RepID=UPI00351C664E
MPYLKQRLIHREKRVKINNKNVLVVNLCQTDPTGRPVVDYARSSWALDSDKASFIDSVVGVYQNTVRVVIKGCTLVPSTPNVVGQYWDGGCKGRWYVLGGEAYHEGQVFTVEAVCLQILQTLVSVQGIRYLTRERLACIPEGITLK